ncbi:hypothetical protein BT63DRAFT_376472 [Microthyrium microscopicum]|uniref:Uncharacterized protein n=1 Tax=Microthyrium microscopicum TaxID=703497 RepID=A0A6A6U6I2_9PEZI|nr:hypothetical protein BT63DRAFT_376472 [Microthyrium microscopicum]
MAPTHSLGIHKPSALDYLIGESILPENANPDLYSWELFTDAGVEEEVLCTKDCVVWSRGRVVRKLFSFEIELEDVHQATLAWFPDHEDQSTPNSYDTFASSPNKRRRVSDPDSPTQKNDNALRNDSARALVVFLKYQAHIFFLTGASHVVNIPFEVERAFPTPRGLILQRKLLVPISNLQNSAMAPSVPQNTFLVPPSQASFSSASVDEFPGIDFDLFKSAAAPTERGMPRHYSLTSPLSELSLLGQSVGPSPARQKRLQTAKPFIALDVDEEIIYVSPVNELPRDSFASEPLLLVVTLNHERGVYTLWNASYLGSKPLSNPRTGGSIPTIGAKSRRRSSHVTPTGDTTPVARSRDALRESMGAARSKAAAGSIKKSKRKKKDPQSVKAAEDALASQVDPDFEARHNKRESRRVSSMIRADLNASFDRSAFQDLASQSGATSFGPGGRRGQSLGAGVERPSFGAGSIRRLRASTPGSFSRLSIEDFSELGMNTAWNGSQASTTLDDFEHYAEMADDIEDMDDLDFYHPLDGLGWGLVLRKFSEIRAPSSAVSLQRSARGTFSDLSNASDSRNPPRVFTITSPVNGDERSSYGRRFYLIIFDKHLKDCIQVEFRVKSKTLHPILASSLQEDRQSKTMPIPIFSDPVRLKNVSDIINIRDHDEKRILLLKEGPSGNSSIAVFSPWSQEITIQIPLKRLRIFNPHDVSTVSASPRGIGKKRTTTNPKILCGLHSAGLYSTVDVLSGDGHNHQISLDLWPKSSNTSKVLDICFFALPLHIGEMVLRLWWNRDLVNQQPAQREWNGLLTALLALCLACEDSGRSKRAQRRNTAVFESDSSSSISIMKKLESSWNKPANRSHGAWAWAHVFKSSVNPMSASPQQGVPLSPSRKARESIISSHILSARNLVRSAASKDTIESIRKHRHAVVSALPQLLVALHLLREEQKLHSSDRQSESDEMTGLAPILAQIGRWLGWPDWDWKSGKFYCLETTSSNFIFEDSTLLQDPPSPPEGFEMPPSALQWVERNSCSKRFTSFPTLESLLPANASEIVKHFARQFTPRLSALSSFFSRAQQAQLDCNDRVKIMHEAGINARMLETLNESTLALLKESIVQSQSQPPTTWTADLLSYVSREDLRLLLDSEQPSWLEGSISKTNQLEGVRDIHSITQSTEQPDSMISLPNTERMATCRLIFNQDQRLSEAIHMIEPYRIAVAECIPEPSWSEAQVLEAQREVHSWVMTRTFALAPGLGFAHFDSRVPLLSEKFNIPGYNTLCVMKPMNNTVSVDRSLFTEDKYSWAWFHSGSAAGLSVAKHAAGIDSSWIVFNRPAELNNRHAGFLLALGLNGHLRSMAKWLAFKYLTPKHTMTSIGLLLGLSASHIGTMDMLVTRLLSVHVTRMLPPGAAELNLSPLTQTAGLMGIGLLYFNSQHRRMSEIMLSEIENLDPEDISGSAEPVRDESYRLAAGFALGLINLGQGADLKGLHDVRLVERLLSVAVGPRPVNLIHLMDQATAGAVIAIMLIFMKSGNKGVARKIDIPDTVPQFDFVRPDILLLRTLAKHLILWDDIQPDYKWISKNLPREYTKEHTLKNVRILTSDHMPFFNILAGLLWGISLKYAGSGDIQVRDFLISYLDQFIRICRLPALRYDSKLTRNTVRNCQDLVALSTATVMAGTGDLEVFRRLRSLHGRVNPDTPYGSHMAGHMAIGALFFGAGCYTFGTSNLATAALIAAFYPVFPMDVTDNKAHLQAFRHFWALAAEARCIIPRDIDTSRALNLELDIHLKDGKVQRITAPKLLPGLDTIAKITTVGSEYWPVTLDFAANPAHLAAFRATQTLPLRRRPAHEAHTSVFTSTLLAFNEARAGSSSIDWIFRLPAFAQFEAADLAMFEHGEECGNALLDMRGSAVDERLLLNQTAESGWERDRLWNLRILLRWADAQAMEGRADFKWIRKEVLDRWKAVVEARARARE